MNDYDDNKYILTYGTLQKMVVRRSPHFMHFFGIPEYDKNIPVLNDRARAEAQPIVDKLNSGELTEEEAIKLLDKIW